MNQTLSGVALKLRAALCAVAAVAGAAAICSTWPSPQLRQPGAAAAHAQAGCAHQGMISCARGNGWASCYAPGTSPEHIAQVEQLIAQRRADLGGALAFQTGPRWTSTATGPTGPAGTPIVLTYSFMPDSNTGDPFSSNVLNARLDLLFGSRDAWRAAFRQAFDEWSRSSGITYIEVDDDGAPPEISPGVTGVRGDVRIRMVDYDGVDGILAYNNFPNSGGDMTLDVSEPWASDPPGFRFLKNVLLHESGHGIGLEHVLPTDGTKLMEPFYTPNIFGPQDDDIRGANAHYGDPFEPNNNAQQARDFGPFVEGRLFDKLSLHSASDPDWFRVSVPPGSLCAFEIVPLGRAYPVGPQFGGSIVHIDTRAVLPLRAEVLSPAGTVLAAADAPSVGSTVLTPLLQVPAGMNHVLVRVTASASSGVQLYSLKMTASGAAARRVNVTSEPPGVTVSSSQFDASGKNTLVTPDFFGFPLDQTMTISAPLVAGSGLFARWVVNGAEQPLDLRDVSLTTSGNFDIKAIYTTAITVNAGPDVSIFPNENVQLNPAVNEEQLQAPIRYEWSPVLGITSPLSKAPVARPTATTLYTLKVTDARGLTASDSLLITVLPPLAASAGEDQFVAPAQPFRLTGGASGGTPPYSFNWAPAAGLGQSGAAVVDGAVQDSTVYTLTVTDANGKTASDTVVITVIKPLAVELGDDRFVTAGGFVLIDPQISGGGGPFGVVWLPAPTQRDGNRAVIYPKGNERYTVTITDSQGQQASDAVTVFVVNPLAVAASASAAETAPGGSVTLAADVTGGQPPFTFDWTPRETLDNPAAQNPVASPPSTTTYTVNVRDGGGRTASAAVQVTVNANAGRSAVAATGGCGGASLALVGGLCAVSVALGRRRTSR